MFTVDVKQQSNNNKSYLNEDVQVAKVFRILTFYIFQILRDSQIVCSKIEDSDETAGMLKAVRRGPCLHMLGFSLNASNILLSEIKEFIPV